MRNHCILSKEAAIVWVNGKHPEDFPYLREITFDNGRRGTSPGKVPVNVVAYSVMRPDAPNDGHPAEFTRRLWHFRDTDPYECDRDHPNYSNVCPCEGVKPSSIRAGQESAGGRE